MAVAKVGDCQLRQTRDVQRSSARDVREEGSHTWAKTRGRPALRESQERALVYDHPGQEET